MVPQTRNKRRHSSISTDGRDHTASLPAELFHSILSFLPDLEIVPLRRVNKLWHGRIDARNWLYRSLICRTEEQSSLVRRYVRDRIDDYGKHLRYLDFDFTWNKKVDEEFWDVDDAFLRVNRDCKHLQTIILRAPGIDQSIMRTMVTKLPEKKELRTLKLSDLWWSQFHQLLPGLPQCQALKTLDISLRSTNFPEPDSAYYWHTWNNLVREEYAATEETPVPMLKESLRGLQSLSIDIIIPPTSGPGVTTGRPHHLEQMYLPLVALLASAENLVGLTIINTKSTSTEFEPGNWHFSLEGNWMPYETVFENISKTHKSLKTVTVRNVVLNARALNALDGIQVVDQGTQDIDDEGGIRPPRSRQDE